MPSYRKLDIDELGQIDFYASMGAMGEFEDKHGILVNELISSGKISMSLAVKLTYECHIVACIRLNKEPLTFEKFRAFSDMKVLVLANELIGDVVNDAVNSNATENQKKTTKAA